MGKISHYFRATRVTEENKQSAAEAAATRANSGRRIEGYGAAPCQTYPSMPLIDGYGLVMVAMLKRACMDYVNGRFVDAALAMEWLLMDGPFYLEALEINVEIEEWLIQASTMELNFDVRGFNIGRYR